MPSTTLRTPTNLNITGRGLSPSRPRTPASPEDANMLTVANSSRTSLSEDGGDTSSEEFTVLDGVRQMHQMLVRKIETLRLKIKVDEKNYDQEKARLLEVKESELKSKDEEIEELRESVTARDDAIGHLTRAAAEKDRTIESKCAEIEELKGMVRQTKEYAEKMHKQVKLAKQRQSQLESDPLYKEQNEEISRLTREVESLRESLANMDSELRRALTVIDQQSERLKTMDEDREALHAKFREDLDRASKAMRQEVERMREVMRQNYDEIRTLREQNQDMHGDVREIMEALRAGQRLPAAAHHYQESGSGYPRPLTASPHPAPSYGRHTHGQVTAVPPKGPGRMVGVTMSRNSASANRRVYSGAAPIPTLRESSQFGVPANSGKAAGGTGAGTGGTMGRGAEAKGSRLQSESGYYSGGSSNNTARSSAHVIGSRAAISRLPNETRKLPQSQSTSRAEDGKSLPAICSFKEGVVPAGRQPSGRGRLTVRKGSAVARK